eukprot:SAG31_NODE_2443_length_5682_cov_3.662428_6_plen_155_part_00
MHINDRSWLSFVVHEIYIYIKIAAGRLPRQHDGTVRRVRGQRNATAAPWHCAAAWARARYRLSADGGGGGGGGPSTGGLILKKLQTIEPRRRLCAAGPLELPLTLSPIACRRLHPLLVGGARPTPAAPVIAVGPDAVRAVTFSFLCNYSRNTGL